MKKSMILLASILLTLSTSSAFAKKTDSACPDLWTVRNSGSQFTHAFMPGKDGWMLSADPFIYDDVVWQTHYFAKLPDARSPAEAIAIGQNDYDHSSLMVEPKESQFGTMIECYYSPEGASYVVLVVNQVDVGFTMHK